MSAPGWVETGIGVGVLGSGVVGGFLMAFSAVVMPALAAGPAESGTRTMQAVNRFAVTAPFMSAFFGTAAVCLALGVWAVTRLDAPGARWVLLGSLLYLVGAFGVTVVANVPLNDRLARVGAGPGGAEWASYLSAWVPWNHVRVLGCLACCVVFLCAARGVGSGPSR